jgi:hypothetical protein
VAFAAHRRPNAREPVQAITGRRKLAELVRWWHTEFSVHQEQHAREVAPSLACIACGKMGADNEPVRTLAERIDPHRQQAPLHPAVRVAITNGAVSVPLNPVDKGLPDPLPFQDHPVFVPAGQQFLRGRRAPGGSSGPPGCHYTGQVIHIRR